MSELQTDSVESEVIEPAVIENPDNGADLAAASESEHSENTETVDEVESEASKQQAYINTQYGKIKQGERDLQGANERIAKFESDERERQAAAVGNIPPMPTDQFDDNYDAEMKAHIEGVKAQERHNANNDIYLNQQNFNQQQAAQAKQDEVNNKITSYTEKAKTLGINPTELQQAAGALEQIGISLSSTPDLVVALLDDIDGPVITKYLAGNLQDAQTLLSMNPVQQAQFIERNIRAKASALKPKTSNTPAPATNLTGNGAGEKKHPALEGVIYS